MFLLGPLMVLSAIGFFCWLLFTLAVFALPTVAGIYAGIWAYQTGAGALGAIAVGLVAAGATFGIGQLLLAFVPWAWARLLIVAVYAAPAAVAGYSATHGVARMAMPSPVWQTIFSVVGAIAVGITAVVRVSGTFPHPCPYHLPPTWGTAKRWQHVAQAPATSGLFRLDHSGVTTFPIPPTIPQRGETPLRSKHGKPYRPTSLDRGTRIARPCRLPPPVATGRQHLHDHICPFEPPTRPLR